MSSSSDTEDDHPDGASSGDGDKTDGATFLFFLLLLQDVSLENIGIRRDSDDKNHQMCYLKPSFG